MKTSRICRFDSETGQVTNKPSVVSLSVGLWTLLAILLKLNIKIRWLVMTNNHAKLQLMKSLRSNISPERPSP